MTLFNLDFLKYVWHANKEFQCAVVPNFDELSEAEKIQLTKEYLLHVVTEIDELLESTGKWKTILSNKNLPSTSGITVEVIDMFKFLVNIALIWNIGPDTFVEEFERKTAVNWQKFRQDTLPIRGNEAVVILDLDGVLAQYPEFWMDFVQRRCQYLHLVPSQVKDLHNLIPELDRVEYNRLKRIYREMGMKRYIPVMPGAQDLTGWLCDQSYKIVILTRRPVSKYKRIYADTILWLKKNDIIFDGIFWSEDGEKDHMIKENFSNVAFVVEDDPDQIKRLLKSGLKVICLNRPYNMELEDQPGLLRVHSLDEIPEVIKRKEGS